MNLIQKRILSTIKFFSLQGVPLTQFEIYKYLITPSSHLLNIQDEAFEMEFLNKYTAEEQRAIIEHLRVPFSAVMQNLDELVENRQLIQKEGFYFENGQNFILNQYKLNFRFLSARERRIQKYQWLFNHVPFVHSASLGGSQALGLPRAISDIDLLVFTHPKFMWTARMILVIIFQIMGVRRHGSRVANRFCLNHFLSSQREVDAERNLYKALEYMRLRPISDAGELQEFRRNNSHWIYQYFPNANFNFKFSRSESVFKKSLEKLSSNFIGVWLEEFMRYLQQGRIRQDQFVFLRTDELSFHPDSKHEALLQGYFK
jgi:hypothetical protein